MQFFETRGPRGGIHGRFQIERRLGPPFVRECLQTDQLLILACELPLATSWRTREGRTATSENSTAAKKPLSATNTNTPTRRTRNMQLAVLPAALYQHHAPLARFAFHGNGRRSSLPLRPPLALADRLRRLAGSTTLNFYS